MTVSLQAVGPATKVLTIVAAIGLMLIVTSPATAQSLHPCSFLTDAQISAAAGKAGEHAEGDMPGKTGMRACSWSVPGGLLVLSVMKVPNTKMNTRQLLDWMNSMYDALKGQGWKYEKKDFGSVSCSSRLRVQMDPRLRTVQPLRRERC